MNGLRILWKATVEALSGPRRDLTAATGQIQARAVAPYGASSG